MITLISTEDKQRVDGVGPWKQSSVLEGTINYLPWIEIFIDSQGNILHFFLKRFHLSFVSLENRQPKELLAVFLMRQCDFTV